VVQLGLEAGRHVRWVDGEAVHHAGDLGGATGDERRDPRAPWSGALGSEVVRLELGLVAPEVLHEPGQQAHADDPPSAVGVPSWPASAALRAAARLAKASTTCWGGVSAMTSRGGRGSSPRTTTTSRTSFCSGASAVASAAA